MKTRYLSVAMLLMLVASPVLAEDVKATTTRVKLGDKVKEAAEARKEDMEKKREMLASTTEARKKEMEEKRMALASSTEGRKEERKEEREERKASSTEKRIEMQQGLAKRQATNASRVIIATIERLEKIIVRLESRIAKVKAAGGNTTESETFVSAAKANIADAKTKVATLPTLDLSGDKAKENFEIVRSAVKSAKESIKSAHENLKKAISALKGLGGDRATTTPTTATTTNN